MKNRNIAILAIGSVTFLIGLAALTGVFNLPLEALVEILGYDYLLVAVIAGIGLLISFLFAFTGRVSKINQSSTPDAEGVESVPAPGDDLDELVRKCSSSIYANKEDREEIRRRLRGAAVSVLIRRRNYTRHQALNKLEDGTWTDDRYAKTFLQEQSNLIPPIGGRIKSLIGFTSWLETCVEHTADEIWQIEMAGREKNGGN